MIYASLTIRSIFKQLGKISICLQSYHIFFGSSLLFFFSRYPSFCTHIFMLTLTTDTPTPRLSISEHVQHANKAKKLHGPSWPTVRNVLTPPPPTPVEQKRACATHMSTTAKSEILKKEHAAVTWKNSSPPRGGGPNNSNNTLQLGSRPIAGRVEF